jgi:hypothetical protein
MGIGSMTSSANAADIVLDLARHGRGSNTAMREAALTC